MSAPPPPAAPGPASPEPGHRPEWSGPHASGWPGRAGLRHKRRFVFWRFAAGFGAMFFFFLAGLVLVGALGFRMHRPVFPLARSLVLALCATPLAFGGLALLFGALAFRRIGSPLAEVMAAADAVAGGDLSVRVDETTPGEMGSLAHSFNRMTAGLERAEQQRRNLTADVAHELRTPLQVIQGNLEGVLDGVYPPSREHIAATLEETRLLARLVDDLQTLSLAEAGQLPLHYQSVSAADLLADVQLSFAGQAAEAGVALTVGATGAGPDLDVRADPDRINQVLSNLVANALRYTPPGGRITLSARPAPAGVALVVADTGPGIPPQDLPFIFDRFWRGDRARSRRAGAGSGLGLAIARQLVHAHGGRIRAESPPGQGATFVVELPKDGPSPQA